MSYDRRKSLWDTQHSLLPSAALYPHTVFGLNPRAASIDTPLHAFIPFKHVDHAHPNAVITIAASENGEVLTREIYGDEAAYLLASGKLSKTTGQILSVDGRLAEAFLR